MPRQKLWFRNHPTPTCYTETFKKRIIVRDSNGNRMWGITDPMHRIFYPNYKFFHAKIIDKEVPTDFMYRKPLYDEDENGKKRKIEDTVKHIKGGPHVGIRFDKDVLEGLKLMDKYPQITVEWFENKDLCDQLIEQNKLINTRLIKESDYKKIKGLVRRRVPYLRDILIDFKSRNWTIVACQLPVCISSHKLGTRIDCVVWDATNEYFIVIEFKTGLETNLNLCSGQNMNWPFQDKSDAIWYHGLFQATLGSMAYQSTFPKNKQGKPRVIRCTSYGLVHYIQPDWLNERKYLMLEALKGHELKSNFDEYIAKIKNNNNNNNNSSSSSNSNNSNKKTKLVHQNKEH